MAWWNQEKTLVLALLPFVMGGAGFFYWSFWCEACYWNRGETASAKIIESRQHIVDAEKGTWPVVNFTAAFLDGNVASHTVEDTVHLYKRGHKAHLYQVGKEIEIEFIPDKKGSARLPLYHNGEDPSPIYLLFGVFLTCLSVSLGRGVLSAPGPSEPEE
ncbi:MAG: hypothetical protein N2C14_10020 [Planctomycetales bacterium]